MGKNFTDSPPAYARRSPMLRGGSGYAYDAYDPLPDQTWS